MAAPKKKKRQAAKPTLSAGPRRSSPRPLWALLVLALTVFFMVGLAVYQPNQSTFVSTNPAPSLVGTLGANLSFLTLQVFGVCTFLLPTILLWLAYMLLFRKAHLLRPGKLLAIVVMLWSACGFATMLQGHSWLAEVRGNWENYFSAGLGGQLGRILYSDTIQQWIGEVGSGIILALGFLIGFFSAFTRSLSDLVERFQNYLTQSTVERRRRKAEALALKKQRKAQKLKEKEEKKRKEAVAKAAAERKAEAERAQEEKRQRKEEERRLKQEERDRKKQEKAATKQPEETPAPPADSIAADETGSTEDQEELTADGRPRRPSLLRKPPPGIRKAESNGHNSSAFKAQSDSEDPAEASDEDAPEPEASKTKPRFSLSKKNEEKAAEGKQTKSGLRIVESETVEKADFSLPVNRGDYQFPTLELLANPAKEEGDFAEDHQRTAQTLQKTLHEFGVRVELGEVHTGPVITRYEVTPAAGVRVEKIANLDKNIAMSLRAESVRILAPVPGKGCVGVEVPNRHPQAVCIRDIIESRSWNDAKAEIPIALGKEVSGRPLVTDLTKMPHLLIAGATGAGKTVCINAVIASLLYRMSPEDLRFIMVDPKIVEMQVYNDLPHMLIPVVTEPKKVPAALKWLLREMERRYQLFAGVGVRNIAGFNARLDKRDKAAAELARESEAELSPEERAALSSIEVPRDEDVDLPDRKLPYIVCIVDELADLMMVAPADIETCIARLAQLARAAGIHLIIATQRPSVNVITGVIKANLPSRISFKVSSKVDSRTILDGGGAEALIGKGDLLFTPPGVGGLVRAQGAFVSDEEINKIVDYLKEKNGPPEYADEVQASIEAEDEDEDGPTSEHDDGSEDGKLLAQAIDVIKSTKRASTSSLQRRLRIGYNRAARVMDQLEEKGIVGPENGSSPREILVDPDTL